MIPGKLVQLSISHNIRPCIPAMCQIYFIVIGQQDCRYTCRIPAVILFIPHLQCTQQFVTADKGIFQEKFGIAQEQVFFRFKFSGNMLCDIKDGYGSWLGMVFSGACPICNDTQQVVIIQFPELYKIFLILSFAANIYGRANLILIHSFAQDTPSKVHD